MAHRLEIFLSSPGDVGPERASAERVAQLLQGEFNAHVKLHLVLWEHEPIRATSTFQAQIMRPSQTNIVVCILWSRLGTRLPQGFEQRSDGTRYESGTAFEFEDAEGSYAERGRPHLLVYHKTAKPTVQLGDRERVQEAQNQWDALEQYLHRWFRNEDGSFRAGLTTFESTGEFEDLLERHLRVLVTEYLAEAGPSATGAESAVAWHRGSPFRGLKPFEFEHAPIFFGRGRVIGELRETLVRQAAEGSAFVLVSGMSGCGKSSLVRAGLLPLVTQPGVVEGVGLWRWCVFTPSQASGDLCQGLATALVDNRVLPELAAAGADTATLAETLEAAPEQAILPLRMGLKRAAADELDRDGLVRLPVPRLLLVVDQLEELFTLDWLDEGARTRFVAALAALARSGLVWVVATMRSDLFHRCAELPTLATLAQGMGQYHLLAPQRAEIAQMIQKPARAAGLAFETDSNEIGLDQVLEEAAARDPAALPLLEYTLDELFQLRTERGILTYEAYEETLGGFEGAIARRAEEIFAGLEPAAQATLPEVFGALITVGSNNLTIAARRVSRARFESKPAAAVVDAFVDARLLVADRASDGTPILGMAHESLAERWPRLSTWVDGNRRLLSIQARVADARQRWDQEGRLPEYLLPRGRPLEDGKELLAGSQTILLPEEIAFVEASIAASEEIERAERRAERRAASRALALEAVGLLEKHPQLAVLVATEAVRQTVQHGDPVVEEASDNLTHILASVQGIPATTLRGAPAWMGFSADESWFVTTDHVATVQLWKVLEDGLAEEPVDIDFAPAAVRRVAVPTNGPWVAVDLSSGEPDEGMRLLTLDKHGLASMRDVPGSFVTLSPDGRWLVTRSGYDPPWLWDVGSSPMAHEPVELPQHYGETGSISISPDSRWLTTVNQAGNPMVWDLSTGIDPQQARVLSGSTGVLTLRFSPDSRRLFASNTTSSSGGSGAKGQVWSLPEPPAEPSSYGVLGKNMALAEFSPDSNWLATVGWNDMYQDRYLQLWRLDRSPHVRYGLRQIEEITSAAFSPDGQWIATASQFDGFGFLWDLKILSSVDPDCAHQTLTPIPVGPHHRGVSLLTFTATAGAILTLDRDGRLRQFRLERSEAEGERPLWHLSSDSPVPLLGHEAAITAWTLSRQHHLLVSAAGNEQLRFWHLPPAVGDHPGTFDWGQVQADAERKAGRNMTTAEWKQYLPGQPYSKTFDRFPLEPD